jgi:hypothetical protein
MSITITASRLQRSWEQDTRRDPPWQRWADHSPLLDAAPVTLVRRLADPDDTSSRATLAALVELARRGDRHATLLVTFTLLPQLFSSRTAARQRDSEWCEELAGRLWEAVATASNPDVPTLREVLRRQAWRRFWAVRRTDHRLVPLHVHGDLAALGRPVEDEATSRLHVASTIAGLTADFQLTPVARHILEGIAAGIDPAQPGQSAAAARKRRWRTAVAVRGCPGLLADLTA